MLKIEIDGKAMHLQTAGTVGMQIVELCRVISGYYSQLPAELQPGFRKFLAENAKESGALWSFTYACMPLGGKDDGQT